MYRYFNNQKGGALILVLIVLVVLMILGMSLLTTAVSDTKMAAYQENSMKAYFIARSGAYTLANYIIKTPTANVSGMVSAPPSNEEAIGDGSFVLDVTQSGGDIIIKSTGTVNGVDQEVSVVLNLSAGAIFDHAIAAKEQIYLANQVTVTGGVVTNGTPSQVTTQPNAEPQKANIQTNAGLTFPDIDVPGTFDLEIDTPITGIYPINVAGETHVSVEQGIQMDSNSDQLNISGNGELHLYVSGGFYTKNHAIVNISDDVIVFVYILDSSEVEIRSDSFKGVLYAPLSNVIVKTASNDREIVGSIIGKDVKIEGNHTTLTYSDGVDFDNIQVEKSYTIQEWQ